jgi:anhydro-N-acetylmuramic acid kinase
MMRAVGVMSGTSMDGIDVALIETDGEMHVRPFEGRTYAYAPDLRAQLLELIAAPDIAATDPLEALEQRVSEAHGAAVNRYLKDVGVSAASVDLIGLHGQTVLHRPAERFTRQLGFGAQVARLTGIDVVNRFRHADVAAGGEGAPLAPLYHRARAQGLAQPLMVLNLGGVANVTFIDAGTITAFDCGPASALLDDFVLRRTGEPFDAGGKLAASGNVNGSLLGALLDNPFFARPAPKSLDRQDFHARAQAVHALSDADGAATLAAFTVESVALSLAHVPRAPLRWLVTGGGRHNVFFMQRLAARLGVPVEPVENAGWDGDFLEAECFGYLAVRSHMGLPLSLPSTTGAPAPLLGGDIHMVSHEISGSSI